MCLTIETKIDIAFRTVILTPSGQLREVLTDHLDDFSGQCGVDPWAAKET